MAKSIVITGVFEAVELVSKKPHHYRVLSLVSPKSLARKMLTQMGSVADKLILEFDDVTSEYLTSNDYKLASIEDCRKAIAFLEEGGNCIVHCHAGVSRSTATTLGYLLKQNKNHQKAIDKLFELRPAAEPNLHIIQLMCEILEKQHLVSEIIEYVRHKTNAR